MKRVDIEAVQTGEPDKETNVGMLRVTQTDYGERSHEVYVEAFSYDELEEAYSENRINPTWTAALDELGARRLIIALSLAFNMDLKVPLPKHRRVLREREKG